MQSLTAYFLPRHTLLIIYQSLIAPHINYGMAAWGQACSSNLEKILILRFIYSTEHNVHAIPLFLNVNLLPTNFIYFESISNLMHDVRNKVAPSKFKIYSLIFLKFILIQHGLHTLKTFTFIL